MLAYYCSWKCCKECRVSSVWTPEPSANTLDLSSSFVWESMKVHYQNELLVLRISVYTPQSCTWHPRWTWKGFSIIRGGAMKVPSSLRWICWQRRNRTEAGSLTFSEFWDANCLQASEKKNICKYKINNSAVVFISTCSGVVRVKSWRHFLCTLKSIKRIYDIWATHQIVRVPSDCLTWMH